MTHELYLQNLARLRATELQKHEAKNWQIDKTDSGRFKLSFDGKYIGVYGTLEKALEKKDELVSQNQEPTDGEDG